MGTLAGAINAAVGSGSLLTLPVLLALGIRPGVSVRSNTVGILFSTIGSVVGYRKEIAAEQKDLGPLMVVVAVTATLGSVLLLVSPSEALDVVVPVLIVLALVMVVFQKRITGMVRAAGQRRAARRARRRGRTPVETGAAGEPSPYRSPGLLGAMGAASVYGGCVPGARGVPGPRAGPGRAPGPAARPDGGGDGGRGRAQPVPLAGLARGDGRGLRLRRVLHRRAGHPVSRGAGRDHRSLHGCGQQRQESGESGGEPGRRHRLRRRLFRARRRGHLGRHGGDRSEEHTSELQSRGH